MIVLAQLPQETDRDEEKRYVLKHRGGRSQDAGGRGKDNEAGKEDKNVQIGSQLDTDLGWPHRWVFLAVLGPPVCTVVRDSRGGTRKGKK